VRIVARVTGAGGEPLREARADVVALRGEDVVPVGAGTVDDGILTIELDRDPGPVWGLRLNGLPVVAVPASGDEKSVELGEIVMLAEALGWAVFHAPEGRVYGIPRAVHAAAPEARTAEPEARTATSLPEGAIEEPAVRSMSFGDLFGSAANQIGTVLSDPRSGLMLTTANVTLRGVPTSAGEDAVALEFPTRELAAGGTGLSELSFTLRPRAEAGEVPHADRTRVPDLLGYTRELAMRKAAAAGLLPDVSHEIVAGADDVGRVVRQLPAAGSTVRPGEVLRLFVGKNDEP
jgi:hypothetical protein